MSNTVLVRTSDLLGEELEEPGGSIDAFEEEGKGRVFRAQGDAYSLAGEETKDTVGRRAEIDKVNHRG